MADEDIVTIAGPNGLPTTGAEQLALTSFVPASVVVDGIRKTLGVTLEQLRDAFGDIGAHGDLEVTGSIGDLTFTIKNGVVTLAQMAALPANSLIGTATAGVPRALNVGSGLHIAGDTLVADAVAVVQPTLGVLVYRSIPGGL